MKPEKLIPLLPLVALIFALASFAACSKKEVKKQPTPEVKTTGEAFSLLEGLRKAYVEKNDGEMKALSTEQGYAELKKDIKPFDTAELKFSPRWVEIKAGTVTVNVSWEGLWRSGGKETSERGMAVFELAGTPLKFNGALKGSPFIYP
jgi:hypothetical protein